MVADLKRTRPDIQEELTLLWFFDENWTFRALKSGREKGTALPI
jgi:hypothetical protein